MVEPAIPVSASGNPGITKAVFVVICTMPSTGHTRDAAIIPAIEAPSSVACLRSLGRKGVPTIAISELLHPPGFSSRYADEKIHVADPNRDLDAYAKVLLGLARRRDVKTIIPVREADIYTLAKHKDEFAEHIGTPFADLETLRSVQDRVELFAAAERAGVATPKTRRFTEWDDWDSEVIVKPRYTVFAAEYTDDFEESTMYYKTTQYIEPESVPTLEEMVDYYRHEPLVQEFIPDTDEYAFFALYDEGEAVATFQHRQRRGYKYSGGPSSFRESTGIPELDEAGRALLDEIGWHGVAMVEFLRDPASGEFKLMEINPRFWTSLPFTVQAGVDFPYYYWLMAMGRTEEIDSEYEVGLGGHLIRGEILHLHSILFEEYPLVERPRLWDAIRDVSSTLYEHPRFDILSADDPLPFFRDLYNGYLYAKNGREAL